jgi:hypothetical protein
VGISTVLDATLALEGVGFTTRDVTSFPS